MCLLNLEGTASYSLERICHFDCKPVEQDRVGNPDANAGREINAILSVRYNLPYPKQYGIARTSVT